MTLPDLDRGAGPPGRKPRTYRFGDRLRLPMALDPARLRRDLARFRDQAWTAHFVPDNYDGDWSALPLRAPAGAVHPIMRIAYNPDVTAWEDTELLARCPYFQDVLSGFQCPVEAVRLMRLTPGSRIKPHSDPGLCAEDGAVRLHAPILTGAGVDFRVNDRRVDMAPGEVWYLRLSDTHSVANAGNEDRVHLVIDAQVNAWMEEMLSAAEAG